ncbi:hypothetical protein ACFE04_019779 [Oxalis oulophora]
MGNFFSNGESFEKNISGKKKFVDFNPRCTLPFFRQLCYAYSASGALVIAEIRRRDNKERRGEQLSLQHSVFATTPAGWCIGLTAGRAEGVLLSEKAPSSSYTRQGLSSAPIKEDVPVVQKRK